jgi:hypothetical protein
MEKAQFYPTPISIAKLIARYIDLEDIKMRRGGVIRILDPSCGEGTALAEFTRDLVLRYPHVNTETWGIEINSRRADKAAEVLTHVVDSPLEVAGFAPTKHEPISIIFGNPPYDIDDAVGTDTYFYGTRLEFSHLDIVTRWLAPGGVLVWIVPFRAFDWDMSRYFCTNYHSVQFLRFFDEGEPAELYDTFGQVIILARKNQERGRFDYDLQRQWVEEIGRRAGKEATKWNLPIIGEVEPKPMVAVPQVRMSSKLRRVSFTPEEMVEAATENIPAWRDLTSALLPENLDMQRPVLPPNVGHVAQMVAGGMMGTISEGGELFKGRAIKIKKEVPHPEKKDTTVVKDEWQTNVVSVTAAGLQHLTKPNLVADFLRQRAELFKTYISQNFPAYGEEKKPGEDAILDKLSKDKRLPGVAKAGLLPPQRRWAIALARSLEQYGVGHLVAEMGAGKTRTSLAVLELLDDYPALVVCPPHMVKKWQAEAQASNPGVKAVIVEHLDELKQAIERYQPGEKLVVILSRSRIKQGPGWEPAYREKTVIRRLHEPSWQIQEITNEEQYETLQGRAAELEREAHGLILNDDEVGAIKLRGQAAEAREKAEEYTKWKSVSQWLYGQHEGEKREIRIIAQKEPVCPDCGQPVIDHLRVRGGNVLAALNNRPLKCQAPKQVWDHGEERWATQIRTEEGIVEPKCGAALWQFKTGGTLWPLAQYIANYAPNFFKCLIPDEVHQYKAKDSDQGWAFGLLASTIPHVVTLTGTFFGGYSTSIFYLLYRTQANLKQHFGFDDTKRWAEEFGVLEETYKEGEGGEFSSNTAKRRRKVGTKERPGLAPAAVQFFLSTAVFGRLKELGIPLPPYNEEIRVIEMEADQKKDYDECWNWTWAKLKQHKPRFTSSWLQWCLARGNSGFRDELVECRYDGDELEMPAVVDEGDGADLLPKEQELVEFVASELRQGRQVVVYLRQTGTRDIRDRVKMILEHAGIRGVTILKESVSPKRREQWLKDNAGPVLITNPKLVETGLDLVQYSTIVFYEIEYSLYTLWQSMRRVWRPGQTQPVKVVWMIYKGTLEEKAMVLIGEKLKAGQLVHGDDVTSALVEDGGGSLVEDLIAAIQEEDDLAVDTGAWKMFEDPDHTLQSDDVLGSMIHESKVIPTSIDEFLAQHGVTREQVARKKPKVKPVAEAQMTLF